jgi:hypothetical protein
MPRKPLIELATCDIREKVCTRCYQRPKGSESQGPLVARSCEADCPIFISLPQLMGLAAIPAGLSAESVMRESVCQTCECSASAGDYCADRLARTCPLSRYAGDVLEIVEEVQQTPTGA